jgi:hypothetical protein
VGQFEGSAQNRPPRFAGYWDLAVLNAGITRAAALTRILLTPLGHQQLQVLFVVPIAAIS